MPDRCSHEENRAKVCAPCGSKIIVGKQKLNYFYAGVKYEGLIKKFLDKKYNLADERYPVSICGTCRLILNEHESGNVKRTLPKMPKYECILLRKNTRHSLDENSGEFVCECFICITGRSKRTTESEVGKGHKRPLSVEINASNGLFWAPPARLKVNEEKSVASQSEERVIKLCSKCYQMIGKGINHNCQSSALQVSKHVMQLIETLPENYQGNILSLMLQKKSEFGG